MNRIADSIRKRLFRRRGIAFIMQSAFILVVALPIVLLVFLSYHSYKNVIIGQSTQKTMQTLRQVSYGIDRETTQIRNTIDAILQNEALMRRAAEIGAAPDSPQAGENRDFVNAMVGSYFHYTNDMIAAIFFYKGGGSFATNGRSDYDEALLRSSLWYNFALAEPEKLMFFGSQHNFFAGIRDKYVNLAAIGMPDPEPGGIEMIFFVYSGGYYQHLFEMENAEQGTFLVLDTKEKVIASNREDFIQSWYDQPAYLYRTILSSTGHYTVAIGSEQMLVTFHTAPLTGFRIIHIVPYANITGPLQNVFRTTLISGGLVLMTFILVSVWIVRRMIRPVKALVAAILKAQQGSFDTALEPAGPAEIYVLGRKFKEMMHRIDQLIVQKEEQEAKRLAAELAALQSQINPHFLLNTLNTIKLMAVISKVPNIRNMTDAFIRLLSASFNKGGNLHTVREEMENLQQYLYIMNFRYGDQYDVTWDIEEALLDTYILKLLLQPIVENAIVHGLQGKEGPGHLWITGRLQQHCAVFVVRDDGVGIGEKELADFDQEHGENSFNSIGIRNVQQRIRLNYGEAYGLKIESREGEWTRVTLTLPVIRAIPEQRAEEGDRHE